ncbi:hypothetical protein CCR75_000359 [Bremia lactucae]|uniref:Uncharacterized protein n=1 Tax=Bremia lactucae TaxID=4779 RepID=A0A976IFY6_BRELC|nr:hypothetical protein CCR75_000359 [Bremia lactucae]
MVLLKSLRKTASQGLRQSFALYSTERVFPNFSIYGSSSAFQVTPNAPQYTNNGNYLKTKRAGAILLSWADATKSGYNYQNKTVKGSRAFSWCKVNHLADNCLQFFALNPSEVGYVLELLDSRIPELSLTHSPNMNSPEEDKNVKVLHMAHSSDSDGHPSFLIKIQHEGESVVTLNVGEVRVFKELLSYSLPRLLGFHSTLEGPLVEPAVAILRVATLTRRD